MTLFLRLGCWGREEKGFIICKGIENTIIDLTKKSDRNVQIVDFLDSRYFLFDRPLYNNVHTALWNLQDKFSISGVPVFNSELFKYMEEFCIFHKKCGVFLRLKMGKEENNE